MALTRQFAKLIMKLTPYQLVRKSYVRETDSTIDIGFLALSYYSVINPHATLVQIGACDGKTGDPIHEVLKQRRLLKAVLVEPVISSFEKLSKCYANYPNIKTFNAALSYEDGNVRMFRVKEIDKYKNSLVAPQLASFSKEHIIMHNFSEEDIEEVEVPAVTFSSLVKMFKLEKVDFLIVDTEGFDAEIVRMAINQPINPDCIYFEYIHLEYYDRITLHKQLKEKKYVWVNDKMNTLAIHERLVGKLI